MFPNEFLSRNCFNGSNETQWSPHFPAILDPNLFLLNCFYQDFSWQKEQHKKNSKHELDQWGRFSPKIDERNFYTLLISGTQLPLCLSE